MLKFLNTLTDMAKWKVKMLHTVQYSYQVISYLETVVVAL